MSKKHLISIFFVLFLLVTGWYFYQHRNNLNLFANIGVGDIIVIAMLSVVTFVFLGIQFNTIIKVFNVPLEFKEWFGLTVMNTMVSYYTPVKAGVAVRAYYLKKIHLLSYSKYASLLATSYLINMLVASGTACCLCSFMYRSQSGLQWPALFLSVLLFTGTMGCVLLLIFFMAFYSIEPRNALLKTFADIIDGFSMLRQNRIALGKTAGFQLILIIVMGLKLYWAFSAIGISVSYYNILIIQSLTAFTMIISITPGNLGVKEGIIGSFAYLLGIPASDAIFAATVDRGISMVVTFAVGMVFSKVLVKEYSINL